MHNITQNAYDCSSLYRSTKRRHPGLDPGSHYLRQDVSACDTYRLDLMGSRVKPGMTRFLSNTVHNIAQNAYDRSSLYRSTKRRHPGLDPGSPYLRQDASACDTYRLDLMGSRVKPRMTQFQDNVLI